ncbi:MAG: hypothetical protein Q4E24_11440 [bacterium]|nr:hypothetical protein [bacterium]
MKHSLFFITFMITIMLLGCNSQKTESSLSSNSSNSLELYNFLSKHVGESVTELENILGDNWEETELPNVYMDSQGIRYSFNNDHLILMRMTFQDLDNGLQEGLSLYQYLCHTFGDEYLGNALPEEKSLGDIQTLDDFKSLPETSTGSRVCSSNWFLTEDSSGWGPPDPNNPIAQQLWEKNQGKPMIILDLRLYETEFWVSLGYQGVPNP